MQLPRDHRWDGRESFLIRYERADHRGTLPSSVFIDRTVVNAAIVFPRECNNAAERV